MTESVPPITDKRRKQLKKLMREVKAASPTVEDDLKAYESRLVQAEDRLRELEGALREIAGKNDLEGVLASELETEARNALYECELIARQALKGDGKS